MCGYIEVHQEMFAAIPIFSNARTRFMVSASPTEDTGLTHAMGRALAHLFHVGSPNARILFAGPKTS